MFCLVCVIPFEPLRPKGQRFFLHRAANCSSPEALTVVPTVKLLCLFICYAELTNLLLICS